MSHQRTQYDVDFAEMLEKAKAGDREGCGRLKQKCRSYLQLLGRQRERRRLARGPRDSDVVQETYLKAMEEINSFEGCTKEQFFGWVHTIRDGVEVDLGRQLHAQKRDVRRETSTDAPGFQEPMRNATPSAQEVAAEREQVLLGRDILDGLRPEYAQVIRLRAEATSYEEIGRLIGRSADAARMLHKRALQEFTNQLESLQ